LNKLRVEELETLKKKGAGFLMESGPLFPEGISVETVVIQSFVFKLRWDESHDR
jgi:hypothetical protein